MKVRFYLLGSGRNPVEEFLKEQSAEIRGDAIYMLHAIRKKTREIPKRDIELILKRIREV